MAWIESHQELARHPKTLRFAHELHVSLPTAVGHLHFLWWWSLDYAQDGQLTEFTPIEIARAAEYRGDPAKFMDALESAGFIDQDDETVALHDWDDYAGRLLFKRKANAERQQRYRESHITHAENEEPRYITHTSRVSNNATVPDPTGPDSTEPYRTQPETADRPPTAPVPKTADALNVFEHYRERVQPQAKVKATQQILARLKTFSVDELKVGIEHFAADQWEMEHNRTRGAPWFFKSDARSEQYLNMDPEQRNAEAKKSRTNDRASTAAQRSASRDDPDRFAAFRNFGT